MLAASGYAVDTLPFIRIVPSTDEDTRRQLWYWASQKATVVFTSINAIKAVTANLDKVPDWTVYTVSGNTQRAAIDFFGARRIAGYAPNGLELARLIIADQVAELTFFCGDKRLDILPALLLEEGVAVTELTVYANTFTPVRVSQTYDAILFFSPSAAASFFSLNTPGPQAVLFAIGPTTAAALSTYCTNEIITAPQASREAVTQALIRHFT